MTSCDRYHPTWRSISARSHTQTDHAKRVAKTTPYCHQCGNVQESKCVSLFRLRLRCRYAKEAIVCTTSSAMQLKRNNRNNIITLKQQNQEQQRHPRRRNMSSYSRTRPLKVLEYDYFYCLCSGMTKTKVDYTTLCSAALSCKRHYCQKHSGKACF